MNAASLFPGCLTCQHLQGQIDTLERNCINEFKANAEYRHNQPFAPLIHRIIALEQAVALLIQNQPKGG